MREIKFRGKSVDTGKWTYGYLIGDNVIVGNIVEFNDEYFNTSFWQKVRTETVGQDTGLKDKNGKEVHEGDIIKWSVIESDYQDHYGDNIPNGHYHEHLGYSVKTHIEAIVYENGVFGTKGLGEDEPAFPLLWTGQQDYPEDYREWFEEEELFKQYGFESYQHLADSLQGFEIIGNIYQNADLLELAQSAIGTTESA